MGLPAGVVQQDLLAAPTRHDGVAESATGLAQGLHFPVEVGDLELDAVPAARLGLPPVWHRLSSTARTRRSVQ